MTSHLGVLVCIVLLAVGSLSSFADTADFQSSTNQKDDSVDKNDSSDESNDDSKEKRSQENIMFGNQQNKANGLPDDLMSMSENPDSSVQSSKRAENSEHENDTQKSDSNGDDVQLEDVLKDDVKDNDKRDLPANSNNLEMGPGESSEWSSNAPVSSDALQYLLNSAPLQPIHDSNSLYDLEDLYRRKRQLSPVSLRKRSLRIPLAQMIQTRRQRLPRRSMRFKRQVDMQDLLSLLSNAQNSNRKPIEETIPSNNFRYPEESSFRYPYNFARQDDDEDSRIANLLDDINESKDDDELMLYPQPSSPVETGYFEPEDYQLPYGRPSVEENEALREDWQERAPISGSRRPSIFSVSRRSAPLFYPIDYRYVPGYKKRSVFSDRNRNEDQETDFGKWGKVVKVPEAYASALDVARLYTLANLLAENESPELRTRRSV